MKTRTVAIGVIGAVALAALAGAAWLISLPADAAKGQGPPLAQSERDSILAQLKPPKRTRPVVAIIGVNEGTEVTDYLMPHGILSRADVADVLAVATGPGVVKLYPALKVEAQSTIDAFNAKFPDGADYVIVPAMHRDDDPEALQWIKDQAGKGAIIIGVCAGAKVVAAAGLLDGKRATTHWYYLNQLLERHPTIHYVADRRIVVDQRIVTTTGISADRGDRRSREGSGSGGATWPCALGRRAPQCRVQIHAAVRLDHPRQYRRVLESRAREHQA
jgi:putative intracellular protease/amidase